MKTFKQLIAEVAQPNNEDELNFKEKHSIEVIDHPASKEHQHSAEKKSPKRRADYNPGEDEEVYEAKMDPVGKEDDDIDNDGDVDSSDEYLHARRKAIAKAMKKEASTSPYAIGMASAMKQTGDKPPLKKSTITKAHKIAKSIIKNESLDEDATLDQIRAILTKRNDGTKVIKDKSGYFHIKYKDSSHTGPYHTLKDVLKGLDESAFVAKAAAAHKDGKKKFTLGDKTFPVTIKKATADKIALESAELFENEQMAAIGRKLQKMAPKEKNDMISNAMANLGDHLESFGTPFGAKNMKELEKKTGLNAAVIQALIKKAGAVKESVEQIDENEKKLAALKAKIDAERDRLGMAQEKRKMKGSRIQSATEMKIRSKIHDLTNQYYSLERSMKESVEQIDELDKKTLASYAQKAAISSTNAGVSLASSKNDGDRNRHAKTIGKRMQGVFRATNRLAKEDAEQIDEVSKDKLKNYMDAARKDMRNRYYDDSPESDKKYFNRSKGIEKALDKRDANSKAKVPATESHELSENFKAGSVKLNDGSSVIVKDQDAKLLNQMFADLNADNKKRMMKVAMADKKGFNEILGFAREAL